MLDYDEYNQASNGRPFAVPNQSKNGKCHLILVCFNKNLILVELPDKIVFPILRLI